MGINDGHRKRLMERLDSGKLLTHEELEMLLFYALPRKNTNGIAHKLIGEFGSVRAVFGASVQSLSKVEGGRLAGGGVFVLDRQVDRKRLYFALFRLSRLLRAFPFHSLYQKQTSD